MFWNPWHRRCPTWAGNPLVSEGGVVQAVTVGYLPDGSASKVSPTWAVPVMAGAPLESDWVLRLQSLLLFVVPAAPPSTTCTSP